jgi:sortase (surface protein transpeptidase)
MRRSKRMKRILRGFFRVLKDIKEGDALVLDTPVATEHYRVEWIKITHPRTSA